MRSYLTTVAVGLTVKRRNHGRNKKNRGHVNFVRCQNCFRSCPKDKAVKRFQARNIVDGACHDDYEAACVYTEYVTPKMYNKTFMCISCACHHRIVRVRSTEGRRERERPKRFRRFAEKKQQ
ncbi:ribosomal protein S26e [Kipferlia bialata]|uniref:40S ribosomal protein S26 n=1 Tax=Kipferlia bialata TaxID=797122 RepID=A0A9K3GI65_9EUKA|nr:ribosomal protein S26e [Kipferlia bialata]|eukprot:g4417.t1